MNKPFTPPGWLRITYCSMPSRSSSWSRAAGRSTTPRRFGFEFPSALTLGGWFAGALLWHFAAMWLLVVNGLFYVTRSLVTGRFRAQLISDAAKELFRDFAALRSRQAHDDLTYARRHARHDLQARAIR